MKRRRDPRLGRYLDRLGKADERALSITRRMAYRNRGLWRLTSSDSRHAGWNDGVFARLFRSLRTKYPAKRTP